MFAEERHLRISKHVTPPSPLISPDILPRDSGRNLGQADHQTPLQLPTIISYCCRHRSGSDAEVAAK
jgi:hypothetical protein